MTAPPGYAPVIGRPIPRIDGRLKVTGGATYTADHYVGPDLTHAVAVQSTIARGRVSRIDTTAAERAPGVLAVFTHLNAPRLPYHEHKGFAIDPPGERLHVLQDDRVHFQGQPVALVIAETFEQATYAALLVHIEYEEEPAEFVVTFANATVPPSEERGGPEGTRNGEPEQAFASAAVRIDAEYIVPRETHVPIELHGTIANWADGKVTVWDKAQWIDNARDEIAAVFGIPVDDITVRAPFVGGAFGSGLRTWPHVILAVMASRQVRRPVKLVLSRRQTFTNAGFRPYIRHHVSIGAERDGKLTAILHDAVAETSRYEFYSESSVSMTRFMYRCPNIRTRYHVAPLDVSTPVDMRAPGEVTCAWALETVMDELAVALNTDPVELRLRNDPEYDQGRGVPFSTRRLPECIRVARDRFDWSRRNPVPGSTRSAEGLLVGYGFAAAAYPVYIFPAEANVRIEPDGTAVISSAAHDIGPGTYTALAQIAADALCVPLDRVRIEIGDTRFPAAPAQGGSVTVASVGNAVHAACRQARSQALSRAGFSNDDADLVEAMHRIGDVVQATGSYQLDEAFATSHSMHEYGAVFAEVTVDPDLGVVRVTRVVGAYAAGRIVNPLTAHSQAIGGMVGGIGMALLEQTKLDPRYGRVVNGTLADYLVPVNADIHSLEPMLIDDPDPQVNPLGVKGIAELTLVGVAPAIGNAVYNATGKRIRELPITAEKLL